MDAIEMNKMLSEAWALGLVVTPVYFDRAQRIGGKQYDDNRWYIKADYNGNVIIYDKPVASGSSISSENNPDVYEKIIKTYKHILNKIKTKNNGTIKEK